MVCSALLEHSVIQLVIAFHVIHHVPNAMVQQNQTVLLAMVHGHQEEENSISSPTLLKQSIQLLSTTSMVQWELHLEIGIIKQLINPLLVGLQKQILTLLNLFPTASAVNGVNLPQQFKIASLSTLLLSQVPQQLDSEELVPILDSIQVHGVKLLISLHILQTGLLQECVSIKFHQDSSLILLPIIWSHAIHHASHVHQVDLNHAQVATLVNTYSTEYAIIDAHSVYYKT